MEDQKQSKQKRKRPAGDGDPLKAAYENVTITPIESSGGRPGSPHRFFHASYTVSVKHTKLEESAKDSSTTRQSALLNNIVVHQHANGLCIVTLGEAIDKVKNVKFLVKETPEMSNGERRKRQTKLLRGATVENTQGLTWPNTVLAELTLQDGTTQEIPAGVWGTVLELNSQLTPNLLTDDPLLDGYLAVILPTGPFPPRFHDSSSSDERKTKRQHDDTT